MNGRTKALAIPMSIKEAVAERDSIDGWPCCIYCGRPAPDRTSYSNAHYIPRSQGGLGVERNILTLCPDCHRRYDHSGERQKMRTFFRTYLKINYSDWNEKELKYGG